jgi:hypothetical protein
MAEFRIDEEDPILPVRITHKSEQIRNGNTLEQNYNYLVYEFETEQHRYRARTYLNNIRTVAVYGPFAKDSASLVPLEAVEIDQRVLAYLRRRYAEIKTLGPAGYVPIE